jgi:hypothetical protein
MTMPFETGAAGGAAVKFGLAAKLAGLFGASAAGAVLIAWYTPATRSQWLAHGLCAGLGGVVFGGIVIKSLASRFPAFAPPMHDMDLLLEWIATYALPVGFLIGSLFWGGIGMLRDAQTWLKRRGFAVLRRRFFK